MGGPKLGRSGIGEEFGCLPDTKFFPERYYFVLQWIKNS